MNNDDKILNILESIDKRVEQQGKDIADVKQGQARTDTALDAIKAGQDDIREQLTKKADKADVMNLGAKIDKVTKDHKRRIDDLEDAAGIPHRDKN